MTHDSYSKDFRNCEKMTSKIIQTATNAILIKPTAYPTAAQ